MARTTSVPVIVVLAAELTEVHGLARERALRGVADHARMRVARPGVRRVDADRKAERERDRDFIGTRPRKART